MRKRNKNSAQKSKSIEKVIKGKENKTSEPI